MYQYRQILVRMRQGDSDRDIARAKTMGRKKVAQLREIARERGWLTLDSPIPDEATLAAVLGRKETLPSSCLSTLEPWGAGLGPREQVSLWHRAGIQGATIHATLTRNHGYTGSYSSVYRFLAQLDALQDPDVPLRLDFKPAEAVQVDFGAGPLLTDIYTGEIFKTWFFVMTLCWSRHQYAEFVRDQTVATWLSCHRRAFESFNGVPARIIIDNAKCAITKACYYEPDVQRAYGECAEGYGFRIDACPPRDPQKKGIVESGVWWQHLYLCYKYIKRGFVPLREFRDLADANQQLHAWVMAQAGNRVHGSTREVPLQRFVEVERSLLMPLPDVPPVLATWAKVKVYRDAHVQFEQRYYSVPFKLIGQSLWLKATEAMVTLYCEQESVATHVRLARAGDRHTVVDHLPSAAQAWQLRDTQWRLSCAEQVGPACYSLVRALFADRVLVKLRAVQGVLRLKQQYGAARLEAACSRANGPRPPRHYGTPHYRAVKTILQKGLDQQALLLAF